MQTSNRKEHRSIVCVLRILLVQKNAYTPREKHPFTTIQARPVLIPPSSSAASWPYGVPERSYLRAPGYAKGSSQVGGGPEVGDGEGRRGGGGGAGKGSRGRKKGENEQQNALIRVFVLLRFRKQK